MAFEGLKKQFDSMWEDVKKEMLESDFLGYICEKLSLKRLVEEKDSEKEKSKDGSEEGKVNFV